MATKVTMVNPVVITNPQFVTESKLNGFHINGEPYTKVNPEVFTDEEGGFNCSCEYDLIRAELSEKYLNKGAFESVSRVNTAETTDFEHYNLLMLDMDSDILQAPVFTNSRGYIS